MGFEHKDTQNNKCCKCDVLRDNLAHCGKCKKVCYCSKECQIQDWDRHKLICKSNEDQVKRKTEHKTLKGFEADNGNESINSDLTNARDIISNIIVNKKLDIFNKELIILLDKHNKLLTYKKIDRKLLQEIEDIKSYRNINKMDGCDEFMVYVQTMQIVKTKILVRLNHF
jgi:hypothetical protein